MSVIFKLQTATFVFVFVYSFPDSSFIKNCSKWIDYKSVHQSIYLDRDLKHPLSHKINCDWKQLTKLHATTVIFTWNTFKALFTCEVSQLLKQRLARWVKSYENHPLPMHFICKYSQTLSNMCYSIGQIIFTWFSNWCGWSSCSQVRFGSSTSSVISTGDFLQCQDSQVISAATQPS